MSEAPVHCLQSSTRPSLSSEPSDDSSIKDALLKAGAEELQRIDPLRQKGWGSSELDAHFANQRHRADTAGVELEKIWFYKMKAVMREIDNHADVFPARKAFKFLDLGCCPGGFSSYILDKCKKARGFGISLPVTSGGHTSLLRKYKSRMSIEFQDLTRYHLGPTNPGDFQVLPFDVMGRKFNIALLDAHFLRTQIGTQPWEGHRLIVSQIVIALTAVKHGGTIVMKLSVPERVITAKLLYMLDVLSSGLITFKPRTIHANRGTFYAVATGLGLGIQGAGLESILHEFINLWVEVSFGDEGSGRFLTSEDLDFIITVGEIKMRYLTRLTELGQDPWRCQAEALEKMFAKKGIS